MPVKKIVAINWLVSKGQKNKKTATQTDKQVRQSKGFNL
jgi:hypothetical protein